MRRTGPRLEHRRNRLEKRYRRLLALYPKDHRRAHAEEMIGVLLAATADDTPARLPRPAAWAVRFGQQGQTARTSSPARHGSAVGWR